MVNVGKRAGLCCIFGDFGSSFCHAGMVLVGVCFVGLVWVLGDSGIFVGVCIRKGRAVLCCAVLAIC